MGEGTLRRLILQSGYSCEELAEKLSVPVDVLGKWMIGTEIPGVEQCFQLAEHLRVSLYDVYLALISV